MTAVGNMKGIKMQTKQSEKAGQTVNVQWTTVNLKHDVGSTLLFHCGKWEQGSPLTTPPDYAMAFRGCREKKLAKSNL